MRTIALISEHASPLASPGSVDSGGQNIYVANLAREMAARGTHVDIFTRRDDPDLPPVTHWLPGVRVLHVPAGPAHAIPKEELLPYMNAFSAFLQYHFRNAARPYDVVHANFFMSGHAALPAARANGIPLVMTFHALDRVRRQHQGSADRFPPERYAIERELVRQAQRLIAECPQDREDLILHYGAEVSRIDVIPCGFDDREFVPLDKRTARLALGWHPTRFAILQLGRMVPRKGVDNVIRALALLRHRYGVEAQLYIVGGDAPDPNDMATPELARLRAIAADAGVTDAVEFCGRRDRDLLSLFYGACDAFVTTPWYEPFGITPVEAMACARPVVGAAVGGIRSTVVDGHTGYLVPPRDPEALAERLAYLAARPDTARQLGIHGLQRARQRYTWSGVARDMLRSYASLVRPAAVAHSGIGHPVADEALVAK
ncbi:D-inositol 3-phosphate glycosyltransferase [Pigmentiphaga humi]|uniref:D-inositol 3-phosphate glycosyltransferase n=1 Tax=Pigmentiphaga humi TaxID=2478468 RepID=A0A3P4B2W5_9BURK|nr:glycosyltransferase family 1 protein [Pigmentiphaga humi]VCU69978.1 D-inositol 3-phosphate glycosyltransferase [Pigmentiphaga humi]